jgi:hypothetical protein
MYEDITLANLKKGAVEKLFQMELRKILDNIFDENADNKKKREINIKVTFEMESIEKVLYRIECSSKLAPPKACGGKLSLSAVGEEKGLFVETSENMQFPFAGNEKR